jgi:flagellar biosynthetic protein FliR
MTLDLPAETLLAALLASVRAAAWLMIAPPFSSKAVPARVKALLSVAISLPMLPHAVRGVPSLEIASILSAVVLQVAVGAALGFLCYLIFVAVQVAGDLIDVFGGFSLAFAFDPLSQSGSSVFGRLYQWTALALLLASGGYLIVLNGFLRTYRTIALDGGLAQGPLVTTLADGIGQMMLSAVQIAAPLLAVLFLADVALGLLTRVAPALNAFAMGFPFKILLTLMLVGAAFAGLPGVVDGLVQRIGNALLSVAGG